MTNEREDKKFIENLRNRTPAVKKKGRGRPAKIVSDARVRRMVDMIMLGHTYRQIVDELTVEFGVSESSIQKLMARGNQFIRENIKIDTETLVIQHIEKYREIINDWNKVDGKTQISAMQAIEKLLKLHNPETQVNNNTLNLNLKDLSVKDLKELLNS